MKLLQVVPSLALRAGGPAVCVAEASAAMTDYGVASRVVTTDLPGPPAHRRQYPVTTSELPRAVAAVDVELAHVKWPYRFAYAPDLRRLLRKASREVDLVNIHSLFLYPQYAAWRAATKAGRPYVVTPHGALDPYLRRRGRVRKAATDYLWQRRMLEGAAALQVATDDEASLIQDIAPGVLRLVLPLGIHVEAFRRPADPRAFRKAHLGDSEAPVVLALGRLARKKGLDILVRALARLDARPDAVLVLAGPDDEGLEPKLRALARELGIADRVFFPGMLFEDQRLEALAAATVWALPSHTENFAIAALEALAAGVPVIVSPAVNLAPLLREGSAAVVAAATPEAFATSIGELLASPERRSSLSAAGRSFADDYDWRIVAAQTARAYESLLAGLGTDSSGSS